MLLYVCKIYCKTILRVKNRVMTMNSFFLAVFIQCFSIILAMFFLCRIRRAKEFFLGGLSLSILCAFLYQYINVLGVAVFCILSILLVYWLTKKSVLAVSLPVNAILLCIFSDYLSGSIAVKFFHVLEMSDGLHLIRISLVYISLLLLAKYSYVQLKKKNLSSKVIPSFIAISIATFVVYFTILIIGRYVELGTPMGNAHSIFIIVYGVTSVIVFLILFFSFQKESRIREKQRELRQLHLYVAELEKNYTEMRRFRHDYKNILFSIESYIESEDLEGLSEYFYTKIKKVSSTMLENDFVLAKLSSIEIKTVKALLANKLILAQELGINADIEIYDKLEKSLVDDLVLVRSLGIILDNAVEAAAEVEKGLLRIGIFSEGESTHIIVANSCDKAIPPLFQLKQEGYSTKGENRGLGLSNLDRILAKESHLTLDTKINKGLFTQILIIGE
jgi:two-component system sensor histidine kinase AgrC